MHDTYLELAAAALDFELSPRDRWALDAHLASCPDCRRHAGLLRADARAMSTLPALALPAPAFDRMEKRLRTSGGSPAGTLRLVVLAAVLAVAALGAVQVGAELVRRLEQQRDLSLITPDIPGPSASPAVGPSPGLPGAFATGTVVDVVVTGLRVRTLPTVDDATSAKFEPLLSTGAQLRILEGPVTADGYDWYRVEAIGSPQSGWVSAADHDGTPWIADPRLAPASGLPLSGEQQALTQLIRPDAAVACEPRSGPYPARAIVAIECRLRTATVARVGVYAYPTPDDALLTYVERMASAGVRAIGGDCATGTQGDLPWGRDGGRGRIGCFLDANGSANVRLTCGSFGIGVLGRQDRMAELWEWTWKPATAAAGAAPGLCRLP